MKKHLTIFTLILITLSAVSMASSKVDSSFLGNYKLIANLDGNCPESMVVSDKETTNYAVWLTFYNEAGEFITNEKFDKINQSMQSSNDTCHTAGPVNPFCIESRKELATYDEETLTLARYFGKKTTFSYAKYEYTKLQVKEGAQLEVEYSRIERPMNHSAFTFTPLQTGATSTDFFTLPIVKEQFKCSYAR